MREIRDALADQISDQLSGTASPPLEGLQVVSRRTYNPSPPCIDMFRPDPAEEQIAFGDDSMDEFLTVRARVNGDQDAQQDLLVDLADPRHQLSVRQAILSDTTLGGKVAQIVVGPASGERLYEDVAGQGAFLGCEWRLQVVL